jgi:hypothetical protein
MGANQSDEAGFGHEFDFDRDSNHNRRNSISYYSSQRAILELNSNKKGKSATKN